MGSLGPLIAAHPRQGASTLIASVGSWLEHFHGPVAYVVCGLLVFGEAAVLLGFVIPGETSALIGGVLASLHHVNLGLMLVVVVVCAIVGDSVGYEVGKLIGPWLVEHRPLRGHPGVNRGKDLLARRGGPAVFLGRWVALARALVPGLSGMSGMRYRTFLAYNAVGGIVWGHDVRVDRVRRRVRRTRRWPRRWGSTPWSSWEPWSWPCCPMSWCGTVATAGAGAGPPRRAGRHPLTPGAQRWSGR